MVKESILIDNSISETRQIIKSLIPNSFVNVVEEDTRRFKWSKSISLQFVRCETTLTPRKGKTLITTYGECGGFTDNNPRKVIKKFHKSLLQHSDVKNPTINTPISKMVKKIISKKPVVKKPLSKKVVVEKPKVRKTKKRFSYNNQSHNTLDQKISNVKWHFKAAGVFLILLFVIGYFSDDEESINENYNTYNSEYVIIRNTYAGISKASYDEMFQYYLADNEYAINIMVLDGNVRILEKDTKVILIEKDFAYGIVREKGSKKKLWVAYGLLGK